MDRAYKEDTNQIADQYASYLGEIIRERFFNGQLPRKIAVAKLKIEVYKLVEDLAQEFEYNYIERPLSIRKME